MRRRGIGMPLATFRNKNQLNRLLLTDFMTITTTEPKPTPLEIEDACEPPAVGLQPRRTLNRLALAIAGLTAGVIGQTFLNQESLWDGLLLYGIAVILFVRALADRLFLNYRLPRVRHQLAIRRKYLRGHL